MIIRGFPSLGNLEYTRTPVEDVVEPPPADGLIQPGIDSKLLDSERVKSVSNRFSVGYADRIGFRDAMEDKIVICGNFRNNPDEDYFAIFDGHAGKDASAYCAEYMHIYLAKKLNEQQGDIPHCITQTFTTTHERMKIHKTKEGKSIDSGTTSLVALFCGNDLFIGNAGDSRAVFCRNRKSVIITEDHKPTLQREMERICSIPGGFVLKNRVQGKLAVARAIGDYKLNPYVSEIPDVFGPFNWRDPQYEFLILACDGLWDVMEEQKACDSVRKCKDPREAAVKLRDFAYNERSKDNISVVVIWFPGFVPEVDTTEKIVKKPPQTLTKPVLRIEPEVADPPSVRRGGREERNDRNHINNNTKDKKVESKDESESEEEESDENEDEDESEDDDNDEKEESDAEGSDENESSSGEGDNSKRDDVSI